MQAFDRQTDGRTDRQMSIARCDLTNLDAHKNDPTSIAVHCSAVASALITTVKKTSTNEG